MNFDPAWLVKWIERLLARGVSQREIERITGVSRNKIHKIAHGERPHYDRLRQRPRSGEAGGAGPGGGVFGGHGMVPHVCVACRQTNTASGCHARGPRRGLFDRDPAPGSFTTALALFCDATTAGPMSGWGNLTALGIVAVVLVFIVTKILPDGHRKFIEQAELHSKAEAEARAASGGAARGVRARQSMEAKLGELSVQCAMHQAEMVKAQRKGAGRQAIKDRAGLQREKRALRRVAGLKKQRRLTLAR